MTESVTYSSVAYSIVSPIIIGRDAQRTAMVQLLDNAFKERGQTLLIAGEAGIGKSRLVAELTQHAADQKTHIIAGRSFETDSAIPCALLADLLHASLADHPITEILQELGPSATELAKLLPELYSLLPATTSLPPGSAEADKRRLFEALLFCFLSPPHPTLILIEDAHWCDNTSLDFLLFLARKIVAHPILLLITYRDNEVSAPLGRLLAALDRERLAVEIRLARLTKPQTEAMVRAIFTLPRPVQEDFLDALYSLTEGNPFFIEEILKSCVATGDIFQVGGQWGRKLLSELHIPRSVQVAVRQRIEQLTLAAQELLKSAAVIGQCFDFSLLQQVSHLDESTLVALLKELMTAQLLVEAGADRFAFRHALTRQAVYFMLLARERRTFHRIVAEAIEQLPGSNARLPELAHHFYTAEEWHQCWEYARRAGERAQTLFAPRAAL
jgi:predicted ATPase